MARWNGGSHVSESAGQRGFRRRSTRKVEGVLLDKTRVAVAHVSEFSMNI